MEWRVHQDRGSACGQLRKWHATIDKATILAADSRVEVSGSLPIEAGASEGTVQLKTQLNLQGIARLVPSLANIDLQGTASIDGALRGTLQRLTEPED